MRIRINILCCLCVLLLSAGVLAAASVEEQLAELAKRVEVLEQELAELKKNPEKMKPGDLVHYPMDASLADIVLPPNSSPEQVDLYVNAILMHSAKKRRFSSSDIEVSKLSMVGSKNMESLLKASARYSRNFYLKIAIDNLILPEHKDMLLMHLVYCRDLAEIVDKMNWEEDARETLLAVLEKQPEYLPTEWIHCIAKLKDPATIPALKWFFVNGSNQSWTYRSIKDMPGIDLNNEVREIWQNPDLDSWAKDSMAVIAAEFGHRSGLDHLIHKLENASEEWDAKEMSKHIKKVLKSDLKDAELIKWYKWHKDELVFDEEERRFVHGLGEKAEPAVDDF